MNLAVFSNRKIFKARFRKLFISLLVVTIVIAIVLVPIEAGAPGSFITSYGDSFWYVITTVTTVGYGDIVPVTELGRVVASFLQIVGIIMYGSLVGTITVYLNRSQDEYYWQKMFTMVANIEKELDDLKKQSNYLVKEKEEKSEN
jgi:voltage-gated potassium channel